MREMEVGWALRQCGSGGGSGGGGRAAEAKNPCMVLSVPHKPTVGPAQFVSFSSTKVHTICAFGARNGEKSK